MSPDPLSLEALRAADPHAPTPTGKSEWRFSCPLSTCAGKKTDSAHRSMAVNSRTGAYHCHRCGADGKLTEYWTERNKRPRINDRNTARARMRAAFGLNSAPDPLPAPNTSSAADPPPSAEWKQNLHGLRPLARTPGAEYLAGRGIPADIADRAGAKYTTDYHDAPAVVFPLRDISGNLMAAQGRRLDPNAKPKAITAGSMKEGVFQTPGALDADILVITEAPIDALSLAACGLPAVALCGTTLRPWLARAAAFRTVWLAFDADEAGDKAVVTWTAELSKYGADIKRLRPAGGKDWNELLITHGPEALSESIEQFRPPAPEVFPTEAETPPAPSDPLSALPLALEEEQTEAATNAAVLLAPYAGLIDGAQRGELPSGPVELRTGSTITDPALFILKSVQEIEAATVPDRVGLSIWQNVVKDRLETLQKLDLWADEKTWGDS